MVGSATPAQDFIEMMKHPAQQSTGWVFNASGESLPTLEGKGILESLALLRELCLCAHLNRQCHVTTEDQDSSVGAGEHR